MREITLEEWLSEGKDFFGENSKQWKFKCCKCGGVQCMQDFIDAGVEAPDEKVHFSCIGRFVKGRGCDWTLGGLLRMHTTEVVIEEKKVPVFEYAIEKMTTVQLLRNKYPASEYVLIEEVSDASGFSRSRSLDFMVINLWESRGLAITGIERKSSRTDWLKELKTPEKQENHFKYCDYFYLLTDKENIARVEEIPDAWGWLHVVNNRMIRVRKQAPKLTPAPVNRSFLCAMLRRAACKTNWVHKDDLDERIKTEAERALKERNNTLERKASEYDKLLKQVSEFENASGLDIQHSWGEELARIGKAVSIIKNNEVEKYVSHLEEISTRVERISEKIKTSVSEIKKSIEPNAKYTN